MAKILVTGGAGFIGSHIVDVFLREKHSVEVIDDLSSGRRENLSQPVPLHTVDIRSPEARSLIERIAPEIIVHAAAQISVRTSMDDPYFDSSVNVGGLVNLLQGTRGLARKPQFVFISTGGAIYGEQDQFPAPETHVIRPTSFYGLAKRVGEMYLDLWSREWGLGFTSLRLANVYGPRQNPHGEAGVVAIFCEKLLNAQTPVINGPGTQTRDFVFVEDVARAVGMVCAKRVSGIFNIGTSVETSVNELYGYIRDALGVNVEAQHGPAKPGEQLRSCITPALARETFGWAPEVAIREGLERTAHWFAEQHSKAAGTKSGQGRSASGAARHPSL